MLGFGKVLDFAARRAKATREASNTPVDALHPLEGPAHHIRSHRRILGSTLHQAVDLHLENGLVCPVYARATQLPMDDEASERLLRQSFTVLALVAGAADAVQEARSARAMMLDPEDDATRAKAFLGR